VILSAGAWSPRLAATAGVRLPISTMGLQMMATGPAEPMLHQTVGALGRKLSLKQTPDGRFVIGGGWPGDFDLDKGTSTSRMASIAGSIEHSSAVYPILATLPLERVWVGIEALSYDGVPIIGPVSGLDGLIISTGYSGHGFALSPIIGQLVCELIVDGAPGISLDAFALSRFDGLPDDVVYPGYQAG
jgi:sarcosine oxidase subunit beta